MVSVAKGYLRIPVWIDDDKVTPLVNNSGRIPVELEASGVTLDINLESSDITLPIDVTSQTVTLDMNLESSDITLPVDLTSQTITIDVNLKSSDITLGVTESSPLTNIQSRMYGWDLVNWRKNPIVWGYTDRWAELVTHTVTVVGTNIIYTAIVPVGYVYRTENMAATNATTNPTAVDFLTLSGGVQFFLSTIPGPGIGIRTYYTEVLTLRNDDRVGVAFFNCAVNDLLYLWVWGTKMKINE